MSLSTVPQRNAVDTYVNEARSSANYSAAEVLRFRNSATNQNEALIYFNRPFPLGAAVQSSSLTLYTSGAWAARASRTLGVELLGSPFRVGRATWANKPGNNTLYPTKTLSVAGAIADGQALVVDVTDLMQAVANGVAWFGFRVYLTSAATETNLLKVSSANAVRLKPRLDTVYGMPPDKPSGLSPAGGRTVPVQLPKATYIFSDPDGAGSLSAQQVQMSKLGTFGDVTGSLAQYDSGTILTTRPEVDLANLPDVAVTVPNGTADVDASGWTGSNTTVTRTTTNPRSGAGAFLLSATTAATMSMQTPTGTAGIPVVAGRAYKLSAYARTDATARTTQVSVFYYDAAGVQLLQSSGGGTETVGAYVQFTVTSTAPANAAFASLACYVNSPAAAEAHRWDDITLTQIKPASGTPPYPASGESTSWRVRCRDESGIWGAWSDVATYKYLAYSGTLTITSPVGGTTTDPTPPVAWTTGFTQTAWQVRVKNASGLVIHDTGRTTGTQNSYTIPAGIITARGVNYTIEVRAWDSEEREAVSANPTYLAATSVIQYQAGATAAVTVLSATDMSPSNCGVILDFTRPSGTPDEFELVRDGAQVGIFVGTDVLMTSTTFRIIDRTASPRHSHTWLVRAIVNGVSSADSPTASLTTKPVGMWLIDPITGEYVQFLDVDEGTWDMHEDSETKWALGATRPIKVTQTLGGYVNDLTGRLIGYGSQTHDSAMATLMSFKARPSRTMRLVLADMNIPVVVSHIVARPTPRPEMEKVVTFHVEQDGELTFDWTT